jgi:hypothetical protein
MNSSPDLQPLIETLNNAQNFLKQRAHLSPTLHTTSQALLRLSKLLGRPLRLAVLGESNSGKTTITNFIAGGITLPVLPVANTRLPTLLHYAPVPCIEALCENGQKFTLTPDDKLVVPDILRLEVGLPSEHLRRIELLDFPGSANPLFHADVAMIPRQGVDAVIWATVATQAWRETERRAWSKLPQRLRRRGILAVTQCDLIRDEADFSKLKARLQRVQEEHFTALCFVAAERKHEMAEAGSRAHAPATLRSEVERLRQAFDAERGRKAVLITRRIAFRTLASMERLPEVHGTRAAEPVRSEM